jgi:hypothetical protein
MLVVRKKQLPRAAEIDCLAMKPILKPVLLICGLGAIAWMVAAAIRAASRQGDTGGRVWFYDESQKQLYAMPVATIPPDKGIGGPAGDGYRAIVVAFGKDRKTRRIAYLQKFTPGLKKVLDEVIFARAAHRVFNGSVPAYQSAYFQNNTLVKRVDEEEWHPADSDEGKKILAEWRSWRGPDGALPIIFPAE